ncbi:hypothetical protein HG444_001825 [Candidatus Saccharibacteria bacterium]|nr:hypothetical protein [Candidatus Saccharibacteria bacterium]
MLQYTTKDGPHNISGVHSRDIFSSAKAGEPATGGVIDNSELDEAIQDDKDHESYKLGALSSEDMELLDGMEHGTIIKFINLKGGIVNTLEKHTKSYCAILAILPFLSH